MSRAFDSGTATALAQQSVSVLTFVKLDFASGVVRCHNGLGTYTWGGFDWLGVGDFGAVSQLEEGADVSPYGITLSLSALDATMAGVALTEDYFRREVVIYLGALSAADVLIDDPIQMWAGFMDVMSLTAGAESDIITVQCESELVAFDRSSNLKYTTQTQQKYFPSDIFFDFLPKIEGAKIQWRSTESESIAGTTVIRGNTSGGGGGIHQ